MPILNVFVRPLGAARCLALILSVLPVAGGAQDNLIRPAVSANSEIESRLGGEPGRSARKPPG